MAIAASHETAKYSLSGTRQPDLSVAIATLLLSLPMPGHPPKSFCGSPPTNVPVTKQSLVSSEQKTQVLLTREGGGGLSLPLNSNPTACEVCTDIGVCGYTGALCAHASTECKGLSHALATVASRVPPSVANALVTHNSKKRGGGKEALQGRKFIR